MQVSAVLQEDEVGESLVVKEHVAARGFAEIVGARQELGVLARAGAVAYLLAESYSDRCSQSEPFPAVTGIGRYGVYRYYINPYFAMQGRLGGLYRYARWTVKRDYEHETLESGNTYDLRRVKNLKYHNFAMDLPVTGKVGKHINATTFLYGSLTLGVTKPIFEMADMENTLDFYKQSATFAYEQQTLSSLGKNPFPLYESHQTKEFYYLDDWEFNSWIGVGIDSKFVSIEFQLYAFGGATEDNHRFCNLGQSSDLTWRVMLDFSIR